MVKYFFEMAKENRYMKPDIYMFRVLICSYLWHGKAGDAFQAIQDLRRSSLMPDIATRIWLLKGLGKEQKLKDIYSNIYCDSQMTNSVSLCAS